MTPEELAAKATADAAAAAEATRIAAEEAARSGKTPEQLAADAEAARVAAEAAAGTKTPEQLEAERLAAEEAKKTKPAVVKEDWRDRRIAALTAQLKEAQKPKVEATAPDPNAPALTEADVERRASEKANGLAQRAAFNQRCNDAAATGRKEFPDFDLSVKELVRLVDPSDAASQKQYDEFLEAALETGEGPKIIYALGKDLDEAARVMALSPIKRAAEMAQLATGTPPAGPLPKPLIPTQGRHSGPGEIAPDDAVRADKLSSAEWHRRRDAQVAAAQPQYGRRQ